MQNIIDILKSLMVCSPENYGDFETTEQGEKYHDALHSFVSGDSLHIPELGLDLQVQSESKEVTDNHESKMFYTHKIRFVDAQTGQAYDMYVSVLKTTDALIGGIDISETDESDDEHALEEAHPAATLDSDKAQALIDKIRAFFPKEGDECYVESDEPEAQALSDILCSADVGDTWTLEPYTFTVTTADETITNESDAWSLGYGTIILREDTLNFELEISTDLFFGQDTDIREVTVTCQDASFSVGE